MKTKLLALALFSLFVSSSVNAQWYQQATSIPTNIALKSVHCADGNNCFVAGEGTAVRKTVDGTNWNQVQNTGIQPKSFVKMYNKDTILLGQDNGNFRRSVDAGGTWSGAFSGDFGGNANFAVYDVAFNSKTNFTAVGGHPTNHATGGHITTNTTNTAQTWPSYINVSGEPTFIGIHALTTSTFVACGGNGSIYKTIDGGLNWTAKQTGVPTTTFYDINWAPNDPNVGYVCGGSNSTLTASTGGTIMKTIDAGETWTVTATGLAPNTIYGIHFTHSDTGYAVGHGGKIYITVTGGTTWLPQISPVTTPLHKVYFPTSKIGYICGANAVILKTTTGGYVAPMSANAGTDKSICPGFCATLTSSASGGTLPYTYSWNPGGFTTSAISVCPTSTTNYTLTVTDANSNALVDDASVTVHAVPNISFSGLDSLYCFDVTADALIGSPTGGTFVGPGVTAGVFNAATAGAGTHTITYTFVTAEGCTLTTSKSTVVLPGVAPVQLCLVTADSSWACTTNIVTWIKPAVANIDSFRVYRKIGGVLTKIGTLGYNQDSKFVDNTNGVNPKANPYTYAISVLDTCGVETAMSDTNRTIWLDKPSYSLTNSTFTFNWTPYDGFGFATYEIWRTIGNNSVPDSLIGATIATTYTYQALSQHKSSRYKIRVTKGSAPCTTGASTYTYSVSNPTDDFTVIEEHDLGQWLKVYPNPSTGKFYVEMEGISVNVQELNMYNLLGEKVFHSATSKQKNYVDISSMPAGIYQLELRTDSGVAHKKITIQ